MPAFRLLMKTVEERDSLGIFIKEDPPFDSLHSDLRWKVVLRFFRVERKACIAESYLFLANSEFAVISIHASRTNCRNPSIFRSSNAATKLKPGYSKANVLSPTR
jgi:hypothetical protein